MTKEKLVSLAKYLDKLSNMLASPVPPKHLAHPKTYKAFLSNEISAVKKVLDDSKLDGGKK